MEANGCESRTTPVLIQFRKHLKALHTTPLPLWLEGEPKLKEFLLANKVISVGIEDVIGLY